MVHPMMKQSKYKPTAKELGQLKRWVPTATTLQIQKLKAFGRRAL
jgi:hypothetical protein